ncbi:MAG: thioredoxin fold domain-containing protein [Thiomargarita sp.]|nr:thioredoxin fold domain-containing protein [Thiomargarita sp.]
MIIDANLDNFTTVVLEKSKQVPVLVDFTAEWCAPCRVMEPVLKKIAADAKERFVIVKVDTDEEQKLAGRYGVRGFPTFKLFRHGEVKDELMGAIPESLIREILERYMD